MNIVQLKGSIYKVLTGFAVNPTPQTIFLNRKDIRHRLDR